MDHVQRNLNFAARAALRAVGDVEPNPMVGAVIVRDGRVIGLGHHRRFGGLHAEREALADCRRRGEDPRGATVYVTLEPCCHHGKQPPCTDALIEAGVARVVCARRDPHEASRGGAEVLRAAGIACNLSDESVLATRLSDPFVKRVKTGLPWVIAKWAQTTDGRMTVPAGASPWISNELSLKRVHRMRARVDAIVTGIGTVLADDPLLTARGVRRVRRVAKRVVITGRRALPAGCRLLSAASAAPVIITSTSNAVGPSGGRWRVIGTTASTEAGAIERIQVPDPGGRADLAAVLRELVEHHDVTNVMLECGPTLLGSFFAAGLVDEAFVYVAPPAVGGEWPRMPPDAPAVAAMPGFGLVREKPLAGDVERWFRRVMAGD